MIAQALADNGSGRLVSFDDSEHWLGKTKSYFPQHLLDIVEFRAVALRVDKDVIYYEDADGSPDFVYIDGPNYTGNVRITGNGVSLAPDFIIIDGRRRTFQWIAAQLPNYQTHENFVHGQRWLEKS
jgi:hypothetical protein